MEQNTKDMLKERAYMARMMAVQALYSQDVLDDERKSWDFESLNEELIRFFHEQARGEASDKKIDKKLFKVIAEGVSTNMAELDERITPHFDEEWKVERIGPLLMSVLRAATFELVHQKVSARIVLSEYVAITTDFFDDIEVSFVNAVLDKIARIFGAEGVGDAVEPSAKQKAIAKTAPVVVRNPSTKNIVPVDAPKLTLKRDE